MVNAFTYFGGIPETVFTDNMKTVVVGRECEKPIWNTRFADFAVDMGFTPKVCRVRSPQTSGKRPASHSTPAVQLRRRFFAPYVLFIAYVFYCPRPGGCLYLRVQNKEHIRLSPDVLFVLVNRFILT